MPRAATAPDQRTSRDARTTADAADVVDAPASASRRERRKLQMRQRILDAGIELFVERGFDAVTLDEVAERADVARTTVYNHFSKKADLILEWAARNRAKVLDAIDDDFRQRSLREQLVTTVDILADIYRRNRNAVRTMRSLTVGDLDGDGRELAITLTDLVRAAQRKGEIRRDVDAALVGYLLWAGYFDTICRWSAGESPPFALAPALHGVIDVVLSPLER